MTTEVWRAHAPKAHDCSGCCRIISKGVGHYAVYEFFVDGDPDDVDDEDKELVGRYCDVCGRPEEEE